jgi:hypothetical protein
LSSDVTPSSSESVSPANMLTEPLNHQAMALPIIRILATPTEARVARRNSRACSVLVFMGQSSPYAAGCRPRDASCCTLPLNWIRRGSSQRQAAAGFVLDDGLQLGVIHLAVGADGFLQFFGGHLCGFAGLEVNRAGGEVHAKGDQAGIT